MRERTRRDLPYTAPSNFPPERQATMTGKPTPQGAAPIDLEQLVAEADTGGRKPSGLMAKVIVAVASPVLRLNPQRARQAPVKKWVIGSKVS